MYYNVLKILKEGLNNNKGWKKTWKNPELKKNENVIDLISWRYNLHYGQVEKWLKETDWNYSGIEYPLAFENTVSHLVKLDLISESESKDWRTKLF